MFDKLLEDKELFCHLCDRIDELKKEGWARDLVRGIQNLRKESGLSVTDRIKLMVFGDDELKDAWTMFADFVAGETLAASAEWTDVDGGVVIEADDKKWRVKIEKN
ncbi:MAG: hypothetical protein IJR40_00375 [Treponema sp.]|nr:hypothetical protein [Treponema sp.]